MENNKLLIFRDFIFEIIPGIIFRMHPYHKPEHIMEIMNKVIDFYDAKPFAENSYKKYEYADEHEFHQELKTLLMSIPEFCLLNVSRKRLNKFECNSNEDVNDERYSDFIDLDACIRNIECAIINKQNNSNDCLFCKFAKEYFSNKPSDCQQCKTCYLNPSLTFNRISVPMSLKKPSEMTPEERKKHSMIH